MSTRIARVVRGLLVAVVALLIASVAHIAGGGQIGAVGLALAFAFSALASISLAGRTVSTIRVSIAVLCSQGAFHLLFGIGSGSSETPSSPPVGMTMGDPGAVSAFAQQPTSASMPDNAWMWVAHAIAAVITIVALVRGERKFWQLAGFVALSLARVFAAPMPVRIAQAAAPDAAVDASPLSSRFLAAGMRHRGPPGLAASA